MKRISNITITFSILLFFFVCSCDKTDNEDGISNIFIESGQCNVEIQKLREYSYFYGKIIDIFYDASFDNDSDKKPWQGFESDEFGTGYYIGYSYAAISKSSYFHWADYNLVDYDQERDFQIEFGFNITFNNNYSDYHAGMAYNSSKAQKGIGFYIKTNNGEYELVIRDIDKKENLFVSSSGFSVSDEGLLTIRKIGDRVSYFINRTFIYETKYEYGKSSGIAYVIPEYSKMTINKLTITYINL